MSWWKTAVLVHNYMAPNFSDFLRYCIDTAPNNFLMFSGPDWPIPCDSFKEVPNVTKQQRLIFQEVARTTISYFQGHKTQTLYLYSFFNQMPSKIGES